MKHAKGVSLMKRFSDAVRSWFLDAFEAPTPLQEQAWNVIGEGENALVIAPTGSGKTLAAFLFAIDALMREKAGEEASSVAKNSDEKRNVEAGAGKKKGSPGLKGVRVLYVSPLKALGADVERNLQAPLAGIAERMRAQGIEVPEVRTAMRTGDTTPEQRRALVRRPPDILITTPESLYLMLTSKSRDVLRSVETVIVDEVHALAGSKRGAHLALSLERLDDLLEKPVQRIGLSATVRPRDEIARFLGGSQPVRIVASEASPNMDVRVIVPVRDMTAIPPYSGLGIGPASGKQGARVGRSPSGAAAWKSDRTLRAAMDKPLGSTPDSRIGTTSIWPYIEAAVLDEVLAHRSTIVFVNSRGLCEKLTARLNELYAKRQGILPGHGCIVEEGAEHVSSMPSQMRSDLGSTTEMAQGALAVIAKAHHGSVSKEKRLQVERELKSGQLSCVVATSSLELGIDMGSIDLVLQVAAPPSVASALQRIGRANHQVGGRSEGSIFPRTRTEIIDAAVVAEGMRAGRIEQTSLVSNPLDVLAQQTVAAVAMDDKPVGDWFETVRRSASFSTLPRSVFESVLNMLAGGNNSAELSEFTPRIVWDREADVLKARPGSQRQAVVSAGTIPDRGMFSVVLPEGSGNEGRRRVGELDEEMVYESRVGDIIALGTSSWRISEITRDRVIVEPAPGRSARLPFWHGEGVGRPAETGRMRGEFLRAVDAGIAEGSGESDDRVSVDGALRKRLEADGLDERAQGNLVDLVCLQRNATGVVPSDKTLVVERCEDEGGDWRVMLHSPYGRRVHEPWAMAISERVVRLHGFDPQAAAADDGILLRIPLSETRLPGAELFVFDPDELERVVCEHVGETALFSARFRECAARALLMSPATPGKRAPLWQQRLKAGQLLEAARRERDFPLLAETARECLQDVYDMAALHEIMEEVQAGLIRVVEAQTTVPSPFAAPLLFGYVSDHLYLGDMPHADRKASLLALDPALLSELLGSADMAELLDADVVRTVEAELQRLSADRRARGVEGVADLLRLLGPLSEEEVAARMRVSAPACCEDAGEEELAEQGMLPSDTAGDGFLGGLEAGDSNSFEPLSQQAVLVEAHAALEDLHRSHRAFRVNMGSETRWACVEDAASLRDVLGERAVAEAPAVYLERTDSSGVEAYTPLDSLVNRHARTHGPFSLSALSLRFGLGCAVVQESLLRLAAEGKIKRGRFGVDESDAASEREWISSEVFQRLRARSLAKARKAVQAVSPAAYLRFLFDLQGLGPVGGERFEGIEGLANVIAQFEGVFLPSSSWESSVFPSRVRDFRPSMLDELLASGEIIWVGKLRDDQAGSDAETRNPRFSSTYAHEPGLVAFYPTDSPLAPISHDASMGFGLSDGLGVQVREEASEGSAEEDASSPSDKDTAVSSGTLDGLSIERDIEDALQFGGGLFFRQIVEAVHRKHESKYIEEKAIADALCNLFWDSRVTNDTFSPVRAANASSLNRIPPVARRRVSSRRSRHRHASFESVVAPASTMAADAFQAVAIAGSGRWSLLRSAQESIETQTIALVDSILDRYGIVTRDAVALSGVPGGMASLIPVLRSMEDAGDVLRGMFVEGLGPAQFASRETIDVLRTYASAEEVAREFEKQKETVVLAADDPACLFGAGMPWPQVSANESSEAAEQEDGASRRPSRRAGSLVVVRSGEAVLYATVGLRGIIAFSSDAEALAEAAHALVAHTVRTMKRSGAEGARKKIVIETFNGRSVLDTAFADILQNEGLVRLPDGMRLYVSPF